MQGIGHVRVSTEAQGESSDFSFDCSTYVEIEVFGQLNTVDTLSLGEDFQIDIARKPTTRLTGTSAPDSMIAGLVWDASQGQNFAADKLGINHVFIPGQTSSTSFTAARVRGTGGVSRQHVGKGRVTPTISRPEPGRAGH